MAVQERKLRPPDALALGAFGQNLHGTVCPGSSRVLLPVESRRGTGGGGWGRGRVHSNGAQGTSGRLGTAHHTCVPEAPLQPGTPPTRFLTPRVSVASFGTLPNGIIHTVLLRVCCSFLTLIFVRSGRVDAHGDAVAFHRSGGRGGSTPSSVYAPAVPRHELFLPREQS